MNQLLSVTPGPGPGVAHRVDSRTWDLHASRPWAVDAVQEPSQSRTFKGTQAPTLGCQSAPEHLHTWTGQRWQPSLDLKLRPALSQLRATQGREVTNVDPPVAILDQADPGGRRPSTWD